MTSMRTKLSPMNGDSKVSGGSGGGGGGGGEKPENWEKRPSGMLVQKRIDTDHNTKPPPTIRVRVKYGSIYHDIYINSQATFGELKKKLSEPTGIHHEDQKLFYKKKERESKQFLDIVGVKDKSKLVLMDDPISLEKRYIESRKNAKMEKAAKFVSEISLVVDKLGAQVATIDSAITKGTRVAEKEIVNLIELLMNELIKLDGITVDGDVKLQRKMQVSRIQKYVETLDVLKANNSLLATNGANIAKGKPPLPPKQQERSPIGRSPLGPQQQDEQTSPFGTVVITQWETFDSTPPLIALSPTRSPEKYKSPWDDLLD